MFKKILSAVVALTLVMGMCSCSESSGAADKGGSSVVTTLPPTRTEPDTNKNEPFQPSGDVVSPTANYQFVPAADKASSDEKFLIGANEFSVELFKKAVEKDLADGGNTLISAESVLFALGMTANGAKGETLKQMQNVLCKDVDTETFNKNMNRLMTNAQNSSDFKFSIANSVWVRNDGKMTLTEQFSKTCKELYNAEMYQAPFDQETAKQMNEWVNNKTNKMIPTIIDQLDAGTASVLLNCIAFEADWENKFDPNDVRENAEFTKPDGSKTNCSMMHSEENLYISDENSQGFIKKYKGGKYAFMAILPNEGVSLAEYVKTLSAEKFAKLYAGKSSDYKVFAAIPKFTYDYSCALNDTLKNMGITNAFDAESADFSAMTESQKLYISDVLHKTHIQLDEQGTKAAAATAVKMDVSGVMPIDENTKIVELDRAFAYAIVDTETGLPVFMGTVCDPSAK